MPGVQVPKLEREGEEVKSPIITEKFIRKAERARACKGALDWLRKKPRSVEQMVRLHYGWAKWATFYCLPGHRRKKFLDDRMIQCSHLRTFSRQFDRKSRALRAEAISAWIEGR